MKSRIKITFLVMLIAVFMPLIGACSSDSADNSDSAKSDNITVGAFQGNKAIDFELEAFLEDKTYKLSDYLGKYPIVIKFFSSYCMPCRMEMPELNAVYKEYKDQGLKVFAINVGGSDSESDVKKLLSDYIISYPVLKDSNNDVSYAYQIERIPVNVFVGKDGIIKYHEVGMQTKESYKQKVKELLEEIEEDEESEKIEEIEESEEKDIK